MAQFDVYKNLNSNTVRQFPYLLEVQSNLFEDSSRSVYIPLVSAETLKKPDKILNAKFAVSGESVRLFPLDISSAPRSVVGAKVGNLSDKGDLIVAALDLLFARF